MKEGILVLKAIIEDLMDMGKGIQLWPTGSENMDIVSSRPQGVDNIVGEHLVSTYNVRWVEIDQMENSFHRLACFHSLATCSIHSGQGLVISIQS